MTTIYADPTEMRKDSRLNKATLALLTPLPGLEAATGADFLITAMETPKLTNLGSLPQRIKMRAHFAHGACLVQRKSGGDFVSSIGDLKSIQQRMLAVAPPGAIRLLVTSLSITDKGKLQSGGKVFETSYASFVHATTFWEARGGSVTLLDTDRQITEWLTLIGGVVAEIRLHPVRYITKHEPSQRLQKEAETWITTGRAFPSGIGRAKREEIARSLGAPAGTTPPLIEALAWAADPITAKATRGIGPKLCTAIRAWLGLKYHERIVYPTWAKITVTLPKDTNLPLIKDQWTRLDSDQIDATFTPAEAELCLAILNGTKGSHEYTTATKTKKPT